MAAIPPEAYGRFRFSRSDLQDLWEFSLQKTERYSRQLEEQLQGLADASEFNDIMHAEADKTVKLFWRQSHARKLQEDVPTLASYILSSMLGGDTMLEPLEDLDQTLVMEPDFSPEDKHLTFWQK